MNRVFVRICSLLVAFLFTVETLIQPANAQSLSNLLNLPAAAQSLSLSEPFIPVTIRGMKFNPQDELSMSLIVDSGDENVVGDPLQRESERLIKYFLTALTIPEKDLWVNLSPYEKDRMTSNALSQTAMGEELLAQDYILKKITASLLVPDDETGKKFWEKIHSRAYELYGTTDVPIDTFHKIWIMPAKAEVFAQGNTVLILDSGLKVLLEEDYLAKERASIENAPRTKETSEEAKKIMRNVILPVIADEVNNGKNFAPLRQIFHALILARWYKDNLKQSILGQVYSDRSKINGVDQDNKQSLEQIYNQYLQAFKSGSEGLIKEEYDPSTQSVATRRYVTGGFKNDLAMMDVVKTPAREAMRQLEMMIGKRPVSDIRFEAAFKRFNSAINKVSDSAMLDLVAVLVISLLHFVIPYFLSVAYDKHEAAKISQMSDEDFDLYLGRDKSGETFVYALIEDLVNLVSLPYFFTHYAGASVSEIIFIGSLVFALGHIPNYRANKTLSLRAIGFAFLGQIGTLSLTMNYGIWGVVLSTFLHFIGNSLMLDRKINSVIALKNVQGLYGIYYSYLIGSPYTAFFVGAFIFLHLKSISRIFRAIKGSDQAMMVDVAFKDRFKSLVSNVNGEYQDGDESFFSVYDSLSDQELTGLIQAAYFADYGDMKAIHYWQRDETDALGRGVDLIKNNFMNRSSIKVLICGPGDYQRTSSYRPNDSEVSKIFNSIHERFQDNEIHPDVTFRLYDYSIHNLRKLKEGMVSLGQSLQNQSSGWKGNIDFEVKFADLYIEEQWPVIVEDADMIILRHTWIAYNYAHREKEKFMLRDQFDRLVNLFKEAVKTGLVLITEHVDSNVQSSFYDEDSELFALRDLRLNGESSSDKGSLDKNIKGGIDMNTSEMDFKSNGLIDRAVMRKININPNDLIGVVPVNITITPIKNVNMLLGLDGKDDQSSDSTQELSAAFLGREQMV